MTKIVTIHGLMSVGKSAKSDALISAFGAENVICPDFPLDPEQVITKIQGILLGKEFRKEKVIFVGTSLGGFWANYFAQQTGHPCVIVNPLVNPGEALANRYGTTLANHATGEVTEFTESILRAFRSAQVEAMDYDPALTNVFLAEDDDVIPFESAMKYLEFANSVTITPDGGHRYESNWNLVVDFIKGM